MGCYKHVTTNARLSPYSLETTCLIAFMEIGNKNFDYGLITQANKNSFFSKGKEF